MKKYLTMLCVITLSMPLMATADTTYVFLRHGEKPDNASGQLTCKGLNRALSLPAVLLGRYGQPDTLYAAAPKKGKQGSSLRALTTLTPLAIQVSQPIRLNFHASQTRQLISALLSEKPGTRTFIAWEHKNLVKAARALVTETGGDAGQIPAWASSDFDSLFVIRLDDKQRFKSFTRDAEGLNSIAEQCPDGKS